jgi:hypothetical protein
MITALRYAGQGLVYVLFAAILGWLSAAPYVHFPPEAAQITLSFVHGGKPKGECRERTADELAKLAPNMRKLRVCPRERLPVEVELVLDGKVLYRESRPPSGLAKDFPSHAYRRFAVAPGRHDLTVRLRDTARAQGFDYERSAMVTLAPGQNFAIDFRAAAGGFSFR